MCVKWGGGIENYSKTTGSKMFMKICCRKQLGELCIYLNVYACFSSGLCCEHIFVVKRGVATAAETMPSAKGKTHTPREREGMAERERESIRSGNVECALESAYSELMYAVCNRCAALWRR